MVELLPGVDINNLIDDIRIFSWEAADILLYYSKLLENKDQKKNILHNNDEKDPVTLADLEVNELIIISFTFKSAKVTGSSSLLIFKIFFLSSESSNNLE